MRLYLVAADAPDDPRDVDYKPLSRDQLRLTEEAVNLQAGEPDDAVCKREAAVARLEWFELEAHPLPPRRRPPARTGSELRRIVQQFFRLALESSRTARSLALGRGDPICRCVERRVARHWVQLWPGGRAVAWAL